MGFVSSPRTATMRPSSTSTRSPQLWLQRTHTVGRFVPLSVIVRPPSDMPVAPSCDAHDDGVEVEPLLREPVLEAPRPVLVALAPEHAVLHELREPIGEAVAGDAEARLERLEAARAEERIAQDEERPAVADDGERPRDRAVELPDLAPAHVPRLVPKWN